MSESQADFLRRLNIESFNRQLTGALTDAQRAMVLALLAEAQVQGPEKSIQYAAVHP